MTAFAAMPATAPYAELIARLHAAPSEATIEVALPHLAASNDGPLLLATAGALAECGMAGLATRMLRSASSAVIDHPAFAAMADRCQRSPAGEIEREAVLRRLRRATDALRIRDAALAEQLASREPDAGMRLFHGRAGNVQVIREDSTGHWRWVFAFGDHAARAQSLRLPEPTLEMAIALIGVPSPPLLARLLGMNIQGYTPPIDIIDHDLETLRLWLAMLDHTAFLSHQRVTIHAGKNALDHFAERLASSPGRLPPTMVLTNHRPGWIAPRIDDSWRASLDECIRGHRAQCMNVAEARLATRDPQFWKHRFREAALGQCSLRVVGFTNRYSTVVQHAMRDLATAFQRAGHAFTIASQRDATCASVDVAGILAERDFDLIIAINHLRFEYRQAMPAGIPFAGWIQDHMDHLWTRQAGASVGDHDVVITHSPDVLADLYGYRRDRLLASSNLTDAHAYSREPLPAEELDPFRCDLSFISHGAETPEAMIESQTRSTTPAFGRWLQQFAQAAREALRDGECWTAQRLLEAMLESERASGHPPVPVQARRATIFPQFARIYDRLFRHQTLEWAARWARSRSRTLRIHGRGWEHHPTLGEFAAGEVASGRAVRAVYQASAVSLQANAYSSLHQRLLDGVASGGMVISRFNPADFVREPFARIQSIIRQRSPSSLAEVMAMRGGDQEFDRLCTEAERFSGVVIAEAGDARRRAQVEALMHAGDPAGIHSDDGLFNMLRDMRCMPARVAADLPGFGDTVFRDEQQMHALLDQMIDDVGLRDSISARMRADVIAHDTFDALVGRILNAFGDGAEACAG